jgi:hypothetical protein
MAQNPALKHDANANLVECSPPSMRDGGDFAMTAVLALMCINRNSGAG